MLFLIDVLFLFVLAWGVVGAAALDVTGGFEKDWPWACCGVSVQLRGKEAELLAHRYAGRTPLPQVLATSQICLENTHTHTKTQTHLSPSDKLLHATQVRTYADKRMRSHKNPQACKHTTHTHIH